jgi:hypothetical protein
MKFLLEIITPERKAFSQEVDFVSVPTPQGTAGVLARHMPLFTSITEGEVKKDTTISMKIIRGEAEVGKGTIEGMQIERVPVKRAEKNDQFGASVNASQTLALGDELVFYTMHEE